VFLLSIILRACVRCVFGCISVPHPHICCHTGDAARVGKPAADLFSSTVWDARSSTSYEQPQRSDNFVLNLDWAHHNHGEFDESRHFTPHPAISRHFTQFFINLMFSFVFWIQIFVGLNTPFPAILKTVPPFCVWLLGWCSSVALQLNSRSLFSG
jgi:hypothetical protein